MGKKIVSLFIGVIVMLSMIGCASPAKEEEKQPEKATEKQQKEEAAEVEAKTFQFINMEGKEMEAVLAEEMEENSYDTSKITEKGGLKAYTDEKNRITGKVGVDISSTQGPIDWQKVKAAGIDFAIIRIGFRSYGETGQLFSDDNFLANMDGAKNAGLELGVYFYSQAISEDEAKEEAEFVRNQLGKYDISLPVMYHPGAINAEESRTKDKTPEQYQQDCKAFCDVLEASGYEAAIYSDMEWMAFTLDMNEMKGYDFWYADYTEKPQDPYTFSVWKYTEEGIVDGIEGSVNLNLWFIDEKKQEEEEAAKKKAEEEKKAKAEEAAQAETEAQQQAQANAKNMIVAIDPGHQAGTYSGQEPLGPGSAEMKDKVAGGTSGVATGVSEAELVLKVSLALQTELESRGYQVVMTKTTMEEGPSNIERAEIANHAGADCMIRVHANGSESSSARGALTMCMTPSNPYNANLYPESRRLSEVILDTICQATGANQLSIIETDAMTGINWSQIPVTIIEMGFMTNPEEDRLLNTEEYQANMVQGIANGVDAYFAQP